jgi:transcriptional regulator with XRE-family HTH domain
VKTFSERLASLRFSGETQKEFADRLGMTQASVSRYLRHQNPDREALQKIADRTGVSVDWLLSGKEPEFDSDVEKIVRKVGARMTRPTEDKEWLEVALTYFDEVKGITSEEREHLKYMIRDILDDKEHRRELFDFWDFLRYKVRSPKPVPLKKPRKRRR